jgi:hypothetical protein
VSYTYNSNSYTLSDTTSLTASIICTSNDGTAVSIKYQVQTGSTPLPTSPAVTLYCAAKPSQVTSLAYTSSLKQVTLTWAGASVNNGGSSLLRFIINRCISSTCSDIGTTEATVYTYLDTVEVRTS